jgi:hypothetical protein
MRTKFKFLAVVIAMLAALLPMQPAAAAGYAYLYGGNSVGDIIAVQVNDVPQNADLQYTWTLDGSPIDGATDLTYTPNDSEIGHLLAVVVSFTLPNYPAVYIASDPIVVTEAASGPGGGGGGGGAILDAPSTGLLGDALVGSTLTADTSAWPQDITLDYQWLLDGEPIDAATGSDYVVQDIDAGHAISVQVSGAPDGINVLSSVSESFDIALADLQSTPVPILQGTFKVGKTIGIDLGAWDDGVEFAFQWYIDNDAVDGATENTFDVPPAAVDLEVYVEVTGSKVGYNPSLQTSDPVTIEPGTLVKTPVPAIAGTAKVGQKLTANEKTWDDGVTFEYQWFAAGKAINGATDKTFALTAAQLGKAITVKVTGSLEGYVSVTKTSAATAKVAVGVMNIASVPLIVGTPKAGKAVTVNTGAWVPGAKLTIVWLLDGKAIKGAKGTSVTLAKTAKGHKLSVSVTGAAAGYISTTKVSKVVKVG